MDVNYWVNFARLGNLLSVKMKYKYAKEDVVYGGTFREGGLLGKWWKIIV